MKISPYIMLCTIGLLLVSCVSKKDVLYFQDVELNTDEPVEYHDIKIQADDIISVEVATIEPEAAAPFNLVTDKHGNMGNSVEILKFRGYLVSKEGTITFPILGMVPVTGRTTTELEQDLKQQLEKGGHLSNPVITVRIINSKVSVLGEVGKPGVYTFTEETISLPEALGLAGDLTIEGNRKEVLLIREENGNRRITRIDLTKSDLFSSPYYYLKPNDVIVVNPNTKRVKSAGLVNGTSVVISAASVLLTVIVLLTR